MRFAECGPEADIVIGGGSNNLTHRSIADAACRIIDNPLERFFVIRVDHQAEVGYDIFDLLALIEREAAVNAYKACPVCAKPLRRHGSGHWYDKGWQSRNSHNSCSRRSSAILLITISPSSTSLYA